MDLPQRKRNRLKYYNYSKSGAYFVTICTADRRKILSDIVGDGVLDVPKTALTDFGKTVEKYIVGINKTYENVEITDYVVMPNHIHMVIFIIERNGMSRTPSPTNTEIPFVISTLKRLCNKEIGYNIFQRSFHDHVIRNRESLKLIREYIHNNPRTWDNDCFYVPQERTTL